MPAFYVVVRAVHQRCPSRLKIDRDRTAMNLEMLYHTAATPLLLRIFLEPAATAPDFSGVCRYRYEFFRSQPLPLRIFLEPAATATDFSGACRYRYEFFRSLPLPRRCSDDVKYCVESVFSYN